MITNNVVNIDGIDLEVRYEVIQKEIQTIIDAKVNTPDRCIWDLLSASVQDDIHDKLQLILNDEDSDEDECDDERMIEPEGGVS